MKFLLAFLLFFALPALAADTRPAPAHYSDTVHHYPHWCQKINRHAFQRQLRACHEDRRCRIDVRHRAKRCGIRV